MHWVFRATTWQFKPTVKMCLFFKIDRIIFRKWSISRIELPSGSSENPMHFKPLVFIMLAMAVNFFFKKDKLNGNWLIYLNAWFIVKKMHCRENPFLLQLIFVIFLTKTKINSRFLKGISNLLFFMFCNFKKFKYSLKFFSTVSFFIPIWLELILSKI